MKPKKLIEVAMPIKEISAESVRDKSIRHGHISTLHLWWARRPLPACRAIVFASLVPDPDDDKTPKAFKDAIKILLDGDSMSHLLYKPYNDIPYTAIVDPMEDTLRNRLMMFIGKFSDKCQENMIAGKSTPPKEQLSDGSLIKWENKNNPKVLRIARELIWVAYNSDLNSEASFETLHKEFDSAYDAIPAAEQRLYSIPNRNLGGNEVEEAQKRLDDAITSFQSRMPSVFDPFAGGGAIPLEAARLGCRSYGNDINPVAHIIERASAEFPQKYGKPIVYTASEFRNLYGDEGIKLAEQKGISIGKTVEIPNRLSFDVEYYARQILRLTETEVGYLYPKDEDDKNPIAYYWVRTAKCSNPSCGAQVPLLRQFYLANTSKKHVYLNPIINENNIQFEIKEGKIPDLLKEGWQKRGSLVCPCCGSVTDVSNIKEQSCKGELRPQLIAVITEGENSKEYKLPSAKISKVLNQPIGVENMPSEVMARNSGGGDTYPWGITKWGQLFSSRQLHTLNKFIETYRNIKYSQDLSYLDALKTYLSIWIDRIAIVNTSFGVWHTGRETLERIMGRQAIPMTFDFPESNPFCYSSGSAMNQLEWIIRYVESENTAPFASIFQNASSGDKQQFTRKSLTATVTDPPYYDAISYAEISDFFYVWLKRTLGNVWPENFTTPQTPKTEECTAIKFRFDGNIERAKRHFENKLTEVFEAIEEQTKDIVSIMFAHQSTEAWTTLCNSILDSRMNITGSWPMDTEMQGALKTDKGFLESSVTVSCRPSQRQGFGEFKEVKKDIERKVKEEVESLYELGFRGADLLTACFGQAVSEFGKYESVEKADGSEVSVAELLEMVRQTAFDALLEGIKADDYTRFYIGWLQLNGMGECDFDDATKFTRVGVNVEINDIIAQRLLIREGNKVRLATATEHITGNNQGMNPENPVIEQVHQAIILFKDDLEKDKLLKLIRDCAPDVSSSFWRVLASLKEMLPANDDLKAVQGLLQVQEILRIESQRNKSAVKQASLFD